MGGRIAVTGVGIVSALGQSAADTFGALMAGERGIRRISLFDPGDVRSKLAGEVRGLRISDAAPRDSDADFSRTDAMAVLAAREAAAQARVPSGARLGVALGGTTGGMFETEGLLSSPELEKFSQNRAERLVTYPLSASVSRVAEAVGGALVSRSICSACSGGAIALVQAAAWLARADVDFALAGGADGLCRLTVLGFNALGATDPEPCRPFDRARGGLNLGEGAAVLVLEREASALSRGATVLAWLDGFAVGAEAHHITHPEPSGAREIRLMREALERAGLEAADLGYINAHGTGTQQNDAMEARALLQVLGDSAKNTWVSSSKAQLGHTLGAAGAVEAALTVLAVARGEVPPTLGLLEPELPGLRHVLDAGKKQRLGAALSSSFGFGGMSCVLAFTAADRAAPSRQRALRRVAVLAGVSLDASAQPEKLLDPERSRRFDRGSSLAAGAASVLVGSAELETGLVLGTAFGNVERTVAFLVREKQRGPRHVSPAEFPHLVPSAPAGNASVYAGLTGPVFAVSDLAQSGEAALAAGCELIELGIATRILVGAIAPRDAIVEGVLAPLLEPGDFRTATRGEGAGFVLLEAVDPARSPGPLSAEVLGRYTGALQQGEGLAGVPGPKPGQRWKVVLGAATGPLREALERSSFRDAPRVDLALSHGYHEALGALALAEAAKLLSDEPALLDAVLILSGGSQGFTAVLLGRSPEVGA